MRLSTWNCQGALHKKLDVIEAIGADIQLVQECAQEAVVPGFDSIWYPPYAGAPRGTGLFFRNGWTAEWASSVPELEWVRQAKVTRAGSATEFDILAVWTNINKLQDRPHYAGQFNEVLRSYSETICRGRCVVAGDMNASMQGPSQVEHRRNLDLAESLGLVSAFHHAHGVAHGEERQMTLKWIGPGKKEYLYHCDFVFVTGDLLPGLGCSVMETFAWPRRVSDHQPVVVDLGAD